MTSISARVPKSLEKDLDRFIDEEKLDRSTAVRKLLSEGIDEWKKQKALELLESGEVSFSKAAQIADMSLWEFSDTIKDEKITWMKDERVKDDLEAV
jgi:predicted HTH domain antitoxin